MTTRLSRRSLLTAAAATPVLIAASGSTALASGTVRTPVPAPALVPAPGRSAAHAHRQLRAFEAAYPGRIGVHALHTGTGATIGYRADERFALASTFKVLAAGAVLRRAREEEPGLLDTLIRYRREDLVTYSPITERHVETGMTVRQLCDAAMRYSDNTAANLLLRRLGGPSAVTAFARSLGDSVTRLDRWETDLNTNLPGDPRDTTTPAAFTADLHALALGDALAPRDRAQLTRWLLGNTTGDKRIKAGLPRGWRVGDKTGSPEYGGVNDVAVAWPPQGAPLIISVYTTRFDPDLPGEDRIAADISRVVADALV
ncbi:class A beta-lactamase [Streptomyces sp. NPDC059002]|uniref:class A beta-lactamase n=1 Tax=Streptomyces sp. NPDC059002 TaxID=3346690 RepID=UPI003695CE8E